MSVFNWRVLERAHVLRGDARLQLSQFELFSEQSQRLRP